MFKKSKILSILIAFALLFSFTLTAYASDITYYNVDATTKWTIFNTNAAKISCSFNIYSCKCSNSSYHVFSFLLSFVHTFRPTLIF